MKRELQKRLLTKRLTRRGVLIGGLQLAAVAGLAERIRFLQIEEAQKYQLLAEENRINVRLIAPRRGLIFDRMGRIVAQNVPNYKIIIVPEEAGNVDLVLRDLQSLIRIPASNMAKTQKEIVRRQPFVPITIIENLTWHDFSKVAVNAPALPGVLTQVGLSRFYPYHQNLAHVVGYVGPVSDYYLANNDDDDPLLKIPRFQVGKTGVEAREERHLRGKAGSQRIEVNAFGRVMRKLERREGQAGGSVQLSVDTKLQNYALARMHGHSASAVVLDCKSGDVLAIGSAPTFDPNQFVRGISSKNYNNLRDDLLGPLRAKAIQGTYAPASTFKMITALAALEAGILTPDETIQCNGSVEVSNTVFHCWKRGGHGKIGLHKSIMESCDVFFYTVAQKLGIKKLANMARRMGLGALYDLPLSAVQRGVVPDPLWKEKTKNLPWLIGDTVNASIGQGFLLASPLQLAVMSARLATGRAITPKLIMGIDSMPAPISEAPPLDIDPMYLSLVRKAMYDTVNRKKGTAFASRVMKDDLKMAGKTGTAQIRRISAQERTSGILTNEELPRHLRDHALFVNYAPYHNPKVAVAVVVEHGGSGSRVAAPIARDITLFSLTGKAPTPSIYPPEYQREARQIQQSIAPLIDTFENTPSKSSAGQA